MVNPLRARLQAGGAVALGLVLALPVAAQADEDDWKISSYAVEAELAPDGGAQVTIDLDFDFGPDRDAHGPFLSIVERQEIQGDPDQYRVFEVSDIAVTSSTGAPTDLMIEREDGAVVVRVGDEDVEIGGVQSYTVSYRIDSLVNPASATGAGPGTDDVLLWNAVGLGWEVPLENVSVTVQAPGAPTQVACYAGGVGSTAACDGGATADAVFTQSRLNPGQGLTVEVMYPSGTFPEAVVAYAPRRTFANSFGFTSGAGVASGAVLAGGVAAVAATRRRRRDAQPGDTGGVSVHGIPEGFRTQPPADVPPGEFGTLIDERAQAHDVVAVLLDLAVRGALHIEALPAQDEDSEPDFQLIRPAGPHDLLDYERDLLDGIFEAKTSVLVSDSATEIAAAVTAAQIALDDVVTRKGWFAGSPRKVRNSWLMGGAAVIVVGFAAILVLAFTVGWGALGIGVLALGIVMMSVASSMPTRTPLGSQLTREAREFERYLKDVTADQPTWAEGRSGLVPDLFERYLPYAVALRLEERWTQAFTAAVQSGELRQPDWYLSPTNVAFYALWSSGTFSRSISDLGSGIASSAVTSVSGSGGGMAGSAGAGASGGGGGGW